MANGHGGRRPGAGRKLGGRNRSTLEIADRAAAAGITPLELILEAMRRYHGEGKFALALDAAVKAAPYVHPRLAAVSVRVSDDELDREIERELARLAGRGEAPPAGPAEPRG